MPSTTNRKEKINKFFGNVNLYLIDCPYEDFTKYSAKGFPFLPQDLESRVTNERKIAREILLNFVKNMTEMSNLNLIQNANWLMAKTKQKLKPKLNLVGCLVFIPKIKLNLNLDFNFFTNEPCYCSNITSTYFNRFTISFLVSGFKFFINV